MKKRVVVGLSGGVDSSVAAYLLKEEGYDVTAVFMINWHDKTGLLKGDCPWDEDVSYAEMVARRLGIPFYVEDLSSEYRKRVVDYMFGEYEAGRTPNPDVLCNREIKFDAFYEAVKKYKPDYVATGHYCRKSETKTENGTVYHLLAGEDKGKDQSYFLCQLSQQQLEKALFPIGELQKSEVREIARRLKLPSAEKKDSQGICFVGKVDLPAFLQQKLEARVGSIIEVPRNATIFEKKYETSDLEGITSPFAYKPEYGNEVGRHRGAHFYTIGQRKGLNVGGKERPLFIIATDIERNIVYVGQGEDHPGLYRQGLFVSAGDEHWIRPDLRLKPGEEMSLSVRIRYRQPLQSARLLKRAEGIYILFDVPQRGIAAGQFAAWYEGGELLGSGVIGL
jgi:tRNA-specific 2-thiouridylase